MEKQKAELTNEQAEKLVVELAKKGATAEKIGLILRDEHGFQKQKQKLKISEVLKKADSYNQPDLANLQKTISNLKEHIKRNPVDTRAKRELIRIESNLQRLKKYFK
jgi:ribosomal protein S15P/S13E